MIDPLIRVNSIENYFENAQKKVIVLRSIRWSLLHYFETLYIVYFPYIPIVNNEETMMTA